MTGSPCSNSERDRPYGRTRKFKATLPYPGSENVANSPGSMRRNSSWVGVMNFPTIPTTNSASPSSARTTKASFRLHAVMRPVLLGHIALQAASEPSRQRARPGQPLHRWEGAGDLVRVECTHGRIRPLGWSIHHRGELAGFVRGQLPVEGRTSSTRSLSTVMNWHPFRTHANADAEMLPIGSGCFDATPDAVRCPPKLASQRTTG